MRLSVFGLGKLGVPLAACFASKGLEVIGVDVDSRKVEDIKQGRAPVYEPGLQDLLYDCGEHLTATQDGIAAVRSSDVTFVVVPTPTESSGGFSLKFVLDSCEQISNALREKDGYHLVVITSTVMPGSMENAIQPYLEKTSGKRAGSDFGLCYSPEFIALGTAIRDFLNPDFLLIGESDPHAGEMLAHLYKKVCENDPPIARMNFVNAELTKLALNTFVTTKITFANMLARICEKLPGADVDVITSALGLDSRIGSKYLKGAIGYGGPCFPRDNVALATLARSVGVQAIPAEATDTFNRQQVQCLVELVKNNLPQNGKVGILGLSYKPDTDVIEEAQGFLLAQALTEDGISVSVYDPAAMGNAQKILQSAKSKEQRAKSIEQRAEGMEQSGRRSAVNITFASSADECIRQADVVVVATPWDEFKRLKASQFARQSTPRVVIDCWRALKHLQNKDGIRYIYLGAGDTGL